MKKILKGLIIGVVSVFFVTIGIDASDHLDNMSDSIMGRIFFSAEGPCSSDMVFVPTDDGGFCIDVYEASPGKDCYQNEVDNQLDTSSNLNKKECQPVSEKDKRPWRFISQTQAQVACAKAGKRLPTSKEWYLASLGIPDLNKSWQSSDCQVDSNWDSQPGLTGSGADCVSAYGAYDMIGNVWEWVNGEARDGMIDGEKLPKSGHVVEVDIEGMTVSTSGDGDENFNDDYFWIKTKGVRGIARGGYWDNKEKAGIYSMYLVSPTSYAGNGVGFRCVGSIMN